MHQQHLAQLRVTFGSHRARHRVLAKPSSSARWQLAMCRKTTQPCAAAEALTGECSQDGIRVSCGKCRTSLCMRRTCANQTRCGAPIVSALCLATSRAHVSHCDRIVALSYARLRIWRASCAAMNSCHWHSTADLTLYMSGLHTANFKAGVIAPVDMISGDPKQ